LGHLRVCDPSKPNFTWRSIADGGVKVYYQAGSFAERHRVMLLRSALGALARGPRLLRGQAGQPRAARDLRGRPQADGAAHLVCNADWRSFDTHEITHVLSLGRWGRPTEGSTWMTEGLPVAVDGWCQTDDVDHIAGYLVSTGHWPGLGKFMENASSLGDIPAGVLAASLIRHLRARYGAPVIEAVWRSGLEAALKARKVDPRRVEAEWLKSLKDLPDPISSQEWEKLKAGGCG
jgi:hypothetical protein